MPVNVPTRVFQRASSRMVEAQQKADGFLPRLSEQREKGRHLLDTTAGNNIGNSIILNVGQRAPILQNQADDDDSQQVTVSLQVVDDQNLDVPRPQLCRANIRFGVGGSTQTVKVSIVQGTTLSLVATSISIEGEYIATVIVSPPLRFAAQMAYGTRPGRVRSPAFHTEPLPNILPGGILDVLVPNFAASVSLFTSDATAYSSGTGILLQERNGPGLLIFETDSVTPPNQLQNIPIYMGCNIVRIVNNSLVAFTPSFVFELAL